MADHEKVLDALEKLIDGEVGELVNQREGLMARMARIRAAARSDAEIPSGLRDFLLRESEPVWPSEGSGAPLPEGEKCERCGGTGWRKKGRSFLRWHSLPCIDCKPSLKPEALLSAAEGLWDLKADPETWATFLMHLREDGWELRRVGEEQ